MKKLNKSGSLSDFWKKKDISSTRSLLKKSQKFFKDHVSKLKGNSINKFSWKKTTKPEVGSMYFYSYDPKHKKTLPLYDRLPLVMPIEYYKDGFLGINLHYLPPQLRFRFLQYLIVVGSDGNISNKTKLELSYGLLKSAGNSPLFKKTIHRYLYSHIKSPINSIKPNDWEFVVFLPSAKWVRGKPY